MWVEGFFFFAIFSVFFSIIWKTFEEFKKITLQSTNIFHDRVDQSTPFERNRVLTHKHTQLNRHIIPRSSRNLKPLYYDNILK